MKNEPVAIFAALNAALVATWGVLVVVFQIDSAVSGGVTAAIGAWVAFAGALVRRRTQPVQNDGP